MSLFRLKFLLLGLMLFVCTVWCRNCGADYSDAASNAFLSDLVIVGRVSQKLPLGYEKYKATIRLKGKRNVFKGEKLLRKLNMITVGVFQDVPLDGVEASGVGECVYTLDRDIDYIFFLNSTSQKKYFAVTAVPIAKHLKKEFKRGKKDIKKILCKSGKCVTPPIAHRGLENTSIQIDKSLQLKCRLKRRTFPVSKFLWFKDGVDITERSAKGFSIKDNKKGSVLRIRRTALSDNGTYECVAKNVAGEIRQQAVIEIIGEAPQAGSGSMKDKRQNFRGTLRLNCKIKKGALPRAEFTWYKDGQLLTVGDRKGLRIRNRESQSRLTKKPFLQSDAGIYLCKAKNAYGEINQTSKVTVINAPERKIPCEDEFKHWCMNNGTCMRLVELDEKYCTCPPGYGGDRCKELIFLDKSREEKLAQDRNLVIIGIISAILLFIGICVASYFLAKRRRDQFYRRRRRSNNGHIEDNIPQIYRPLIGCDDIDGLKKSMTTSGVPKGTQTMETCFVGNEKDDLHLYINPMTGYQKNKNERKTAVSLESGNARPTYKGSNESLDEDKQEHHESNSDNNIKSNPGSKRNSINNSASDGGPSEIFKLMNDLNPKKKSSGTDNNTNSNRNRRNSGANKPNIPAPTSPSSTSPPALNLDTDSDEDVLNDDTPLTPLHISEDEDNNVAFPKIKVKSKPANAVNNQTNQLNDPTRINNTKNEMKSKQYPPKQPPTQNKQQEPSVPSSPHEQQSRHPPPPQHDQPSRPTRQHDHPARPAQAMEELQSRPQQQPRGPHPTQEPRPRPIHPHARPHPQQPRSSNPGQHPRPMQDRHQQSRPFNQERQQQHGRPPPQDRQQQQARPPSQERQPRAPSQERQQPKSQLRHQSKPQQQHPPTDKQQSPSQPTLPNKHQHTPKSGHQPRQQQQQPRQPRSDNKPVRQNEARESPGEKLYASTSSSGYTDSDSSTTTEGCDSPDTAFINSQDLYNPNSPPLVADQPVNPAAAPVVPEMTQQRTERGSPEPSEPSRQPKVSSKYKPPPDIGVSREQYYSASGAASPGRKGAGVRDHGRNYRQSR